MKKQDKLAFIEQLLLAHHEGLTRADIARRLGVHRSTAGRCIDDLSRTLPLIEEDGRLFIDKSRYLNNVKLTLHEVFCLYLSVRLFFLTFNRYSPHAYSGMHKLSSALIKTSPLLSGFIRASAEHALARSGKGWEREAEVLEKLTLAWAENKKANILYRSRKNDEIHRYTAAIYFMEPYPQGRTIYLFAKTDTDDFVRTFRADRVTAVELTGERYEIPSDFDFQALFPDAWGIWDSHAGAAEILLRFSKRVSGRVRETIWHPSQKLAEDDAGRILFRAFISEPLEMVPWIRGWGSDCEVLAPPSLREFMHDEAEKLRHLYE